MIGDIGECATHRPGGTRRRSNCESAGEPAASACYTRLEQCAFDVEIAEGNAGDGSKQLYDGTRRRGDDKARSSSTRGPTTPTSNRVGRLAGILKETLARTLHIYSAVMPARHAKQLHKRGFNARLNQLALDIGRVGDVGEGQTQALGSTC